MVSSSEVDIFMNITENTSTFEDETIRFSLTVSTAREVVGA